MLATLVRSPRSALDVLREQNADRVPELVPLRFARMLADPFAFYRGSAAVMAADLACSPSSGIRTVACGDAHVSNFGIYASPERELVFDLNDFDEAGAAPWEWDVKRLVTSAVVGGRQAGYPKAAVTRCARRAAAEYVRGLHRLLELDAVSRHYLHARPEQLVEHLDPDLRAVVDRTVRRARARTSARVVRRLTEPDGDGRLRFREDPPVLTHLPGGDAEAVAAAFRGYLATVEPDIALLLSQFTLTDLVRRVVGVGSVGTRCYLVVLTGPAGEPLVLQVKEATATVLERYGKVGHGQVFAGAIAAGGEGARVVGLQRMLQAASDPFLGHLRFGGRDYYVRQFHDMKGTVELAGMSAQAFEDYTGACALLLARAHAQSPSASIVAGYVGHGDVTVDAIVDFAHTYADVAARDYRAVREAAAHGEIEVAAAP